jgi:biotin-dependent carboxylase-like uncharacterized protein
VTLQDGGRYGYLRFGVTAAGPMDRLAHATANRAVGAAPDATAVEVSVAGMECTAEGATFDVAVAGGSFDIRLDGRALPSEVIASLAPGTILSLRPGPSGAWCYLSLAGRFEVPLVMGSASTHIRSGIGGLHGRALAGGDLIPVTGARTDGRPPTAIDTSHLSRRNDVIRVITGPQEDYFPPDQLQAFLTHRWTVSQRSDRMAYRLESEPLTHNKSFNIVSDGIPLGGVQVPGDGQPLVLMADRQPTGGYPKIATVIGADIGALAQLRPGSSFTFTSVTLDEAVEARRREVEALHRQISKRPIVRTEFSPQFLLGRNLVDGVVSSEIP